MQDEGRYSVIVRLLLTPEQRGRLFELCHRRQIDVSDALTSIVGDYLDQRADLTPPPSASSAAPQDQEALRFQLRRLRAQAANLGDETPAWLRGYISDLEQEVRRTS